ncbi:MAG: 30S ribosomal protein S17 [Myxococcota bacterium]|jgi:small subunit ribosomal protein S17
MSTNSDTTEAVQNEGVQGLRKTFVGMVVSTKMQKTVVVEVHRKVRHPKYQKYVSSRKKYLVHDENNECKVGDEVEIIETRPLSKLKRWRLGQIKSRAEATKA